MYSFFNNLLCTSRTIEAFLLDFEAFLIIHSGIVPLGTDKKISDSEYELFVASYFPSLHTRDSSYWFFHHMFQYSLARGPCVTRLACSAYVTRYMTLHCKC